MFELKPWHAMHRHSLRAFVATVAVGGVSHVCVWGFRGHTPGFFLDKGFQRRNKVLTMMNKKQKARGFHHEDSVDVVETRDNENSVGCKIVVFLLKYGAQEHFQRLVLVIAFHEASKNRNSKPVEKEAGLLSIRQVWTLVLADQAQEVRLCDESPKSRLVVSHITNIVEKSKKSIIITSAGIASTAGISDFHSTDGLYKFIEKQCPSVIMNGDDLFNSLVFQDHVSSSIFYSFMAELQALILSARSKNTDKFVQILKDRSSLLRCYTQEIDDLKSQEKLCIETMNIKKNNVYRLHEDVNKSRCMICGINCDYTVEQIELLKNNIESSNLECTNKNMKTKNKKENPRVQNSHPNTVFYDKTHPISDFLTQVTASNIKKRPDLLLIIGISLRIIAIKSLVKDISKIVHSNGGNVIFINHTEPSYNEWKNIIDWYVQADCDEWVENLKRRKSFMFINHSEPPVMSPKKKNPNSKKHPSRKHKKNIQTVSNFSDSDSPIQKKTYFDYELKDSQKKIISSAYRVNFSIPPPKMAPLVKDKTHLVNGNSKQKIKSQYK
ncbi:hypothetical protein PMAC_000519 [Pneumocystis sp. 'macacae']|nr:hypothetical protein PMAC_000519 [Pneumocystis sp. 'macacae']